MKKHRRSATKLLLATIVLTAGMSITSWAMTAEEVTAKNPTSYTAGSNSIYGPSLNQEQLKAVAQATADFVTNNITEGMSNDQKIRAGYDYIKNNVTYVDWDKAVGANTAYGGLVTRQAACSGMTRGFIALMEAVDVKAYWIHATGNDHQWNMVEFNDGFYFIDIDANIASGGEFIYKAATHPYAYDTAAYPAIGSHSGANTSGTSSVTEGWKQDAAGWWYQNEDGTYVKSEWSWIDGRCYYFNEDGYCLQNTQTPDGYSVDMQGAWIEDGVVQMQQEVQAQMQEQAEAPQQEPTGVQEQSQDSGAIKQIGNVLLTVPEDFVFHSSDERGIYMTSVDGSSLICIMSESLADFGGYADLVYTYQESVLDAAVEAELGTPQTKTTRQLSNGLWYSYHYMDASSLGIPGFLKVYARINGDRLQMVMFGGSISSLDTEGIMNSLTFL